MTLYHTFLLLIATHAMGIFAHIYQHNRMIRLIYEKQRIEKKMELVKKNYMTTSISIISYKDYERIAQRGKKLGMRGLKLPDINTFSSQHAHLSSYPLVLINPPSALPDKKTS
jgi:hypothetical protein